MKPNFAAGDMDFVAESAFYVYIEAMQITEEMLADRSRPLCLRLAQAICKTAPELADEDLATLLRDILVVISEPTDDMTAAGAKWFWSQEQGPEDFDEDLLSRVGALNAWGSMLNVAFGEIG